MCFTAAISEYYDLESVLGARTTVPFLSSSSFPPDEDSAVCAPMDQACPSHPVGGRRTSGPLEEYRQLCCVLVFHRPQSRLLDLDPPPGLVLA